MKRGFKRMENGDVQITMTQGDWHFILLMLNCVALGYEDAQAKTLIEGNAVPCKALINRINAGNPNFVPYEITPKVGAA